MLRRLPWRALVLIGASLAILAPCPAVVFDWNGLKGSFDTTLSFGGLYRLNDPDPALYGLANGGLQRSVNADDGNLNYSAGIASTLLKANHDLLVEWNGGGFFARGFYFTDFTNKNGARKKAPLNDEAQRIVAEGGELLDAYVYFKPVVGGMPASVRIGQQVLSWGESTFFPNGINSVNPIDVAKLRTPGSELKEALRPLNMVSVSLSATDALTFEAFYLFDWERTRVDPPGTYFSTNDFVAKGGDKVYLGLGAIPDSAPLGPIMRGSDNEPHKSGQWGINARYLAENLAGTEFGLFFMNYHSRLPAISARTPTVPINTTAAGAATSAALQADSAFITSVAVAAGGAAGVPAALGALIPAGLAGTPSVLPANLQPLYPQVRAVAAPLLQQQFFIAAATGNYLIEFPEDIRLFGASFNTSVKGVAIQGELSYRDNQPLQVDDVELLFAAMSSLNPAFAANQIGNYLGQYGTYISGYRRHKVWTGQMTATKVGAGILGAAQSTLLAEIGFVKADLPRKGTLRYDGSGTFVGGDINYMNSSGSNLSGALPLSEPVEAFADRFSWGYQLVGRLDYNNAFFGANVSPLLVFGHDVDGNTPLPLGNFVRNRKTLTIGADFTYQNAWALELRYVNFFGAGRYNLLGDRDYVSATVKYSF